MSIDFGMPQKTNNQTLHSYLFESQSDAQKWQNYEGTGEVSIVNNALKMGNNSGNDQTWLVHKNLIPVRDDVVYKITAKVHGVTNGTLYVGVAGVGANKTFVNINNQNYYGSQYYCYNTANTSNQTENLNGTITGYFGKNVDLSHLTNTKILRDEVEYIRPLIIANYRNQSGEIFLDFLKIEIVDKDTELVTNRLGGIAVKPLVETFDANNTFTIAHGLANKNVISNISAKVVLATKDIHPNTTENGYLYWVSSVDDTNITIKHNATGITASQLVGNNLVLSVMYEV